jgi:hypothetical protein
MPSLFYRNRPRFSMLTAAKVKDNAAYLTRPGGEHMTNLRQAMLIGLLGVALGLAVNADLSGAQRNRCGGKHRLEILDLDMRPDPIAQGQSIREWRVTVQVDGDGECETELQIRERGDNEVAGRANLRRLKPGVNKIEIDPSNRYRFQRGEHCFRVTANIEGTQRQVDARKVFCARQIRKDGERRWTMREPEDKPPHRERGN